MKQKLARLAAVAGAALASASAFADDPVTAAMTTASASVTTYATALVSVAVVAVGFMIGIKYIKKIRGAA